MGKAAIWIYGWALLACLVVVELLKKNLHFVAMCGNMPRAICWWWCGTQLKRNWRLDGKKVLERSACLKFQRLLKPLSSLISHSIGIILHNVPLKKNARSHDQTTPFWVALRATYMAYHSNWGNIKPRSQSAPFLKFLVICGSHLSPCAGNNTH